MSECDDLQHRGPVRYSDRDAEAYGSLAISGTTYEIGFEAIRSRLGDLSGQTWLDFGSGAGRSALFLRALGASLVCGVDHDPSMVRQAKSRPTNGVEYVVIDETIPLASGSMDGAISLNVFVEMRSGREMQTACAEVCRVVKPGSLFIVMSANPLAIGHEYRNFSYPPSPTARSSGQRVPCVIMTPLGQVEVEDTYWTREDYETALAGAGFTIREVLIPTSPSGSFAGTAEGIVGPFMILSCIKE